MASAGVKKTIDSSAIVEMEVVESDESDYEEDFAGGTPRHKARDESPGDSNDSSSKDDIRGQISKGVASYVWEESRTRARKAFSLYANIDILRPYYDVEPFEVRNRLFQSLIPRLTSGGDGRYPKVPRELYGPTMLTFTLIALLLYQMKSSGHTVLYKSVVFHHIVAHYFDICFAELIGAWHFVGKMQEGTLMGSAFATCFGYWFGISGLLWVISYVCNTRIAITQLLNLLGYALFGHCIVLFLTTVFHTVHSHLFFYLLWLVFGGLSAFKLATVLMSRTAGRSQKFIVAGFVISIHLLFLLYLHFAYHRVVEDVSEVFKSGPLAPEVRQLVQQNKVDESAERLALSDEIKAQLTQHKQQLDSAAVSESPLLVKDQSVDGKADSRSRLLHRVNSRREAIARRSVGDSASSDKVVPDKVVPGNTVPSDKEAPDKELAVPDEKPDEKPVQNNDSGKR